MKKIVLTITVSETIYNAISEKQILQNTDGKIYQEVSTYENLCVDIRPDSDPAKLALLSLVELSTILPRN